ncbi:MAG: hypothetical protein WKF56_01765 [Candidatus Limnocylindrales bacterium]
MAAAALADGAADPLELDVADGVAAESDELTEGAPEGELSASEAGALLGVWGPQAAAISARAVTSTPERARNDRSMVPIVA